jgi:hypothetical protein
MRSKNMNETLRTINALRTVHGNFSDKEVRREDLDLILSAGIRKAYAHERKPASEELELSWIYMKQLHHGGPPVSLKSGRSTNRL